MDSAVRNFGGVFLLSFEEREGWRLSRQYLTRHFCLCYLEVGREFDILNFGLLYRPCIQLFQPMMKHLLFFPVCFLFLLVFVQAETGTKNPSPKVNKSVYIYLSPSSQDKNIGFGEYLSEEYRMNQLAQHLKKHLLEAGVKVLPELPPVTKAQLDDPNYNRIPLRTRLEDSMKLAKKLEKTEPDALFYHIALHTNAFNKQVRGAEVFIDPANPAAVALAEHLLAVSVALYHKDNPEEAAKHANNDKALRWCRGVKDTGKLIEAQGRNTKNGMLFEFCFHDEEQDSKWMLRCIAEGEKEGGTNPLAKALVDALVEFVNKEPR